MGKSSMKPNFDFHPCLTLEKQDVVGLTYNFPWMWQSGSKDRSISPVFSTITREALPQCRMEGENQLLKMVFHLHTVPSPFSLSTHTIKKIENRKRSKKRRHQRVFCFYQMLNRKDKNFVIVHDSCYWLFAKIWKQWMKNKMSWCLQFSNVARWGKKKTESAKAVEISIKSQKWTFCLSPFIFYGRYSYFHIIYSDHSFPFVISFQILSTFILLKFHTLRQKISK